MKSRYSNKLNKIILLILALIMLYSLIMPKRIQAVTTSNGGSFQEPLAKFMCAIPDALNNLLQRTFIAPVNIAPKNFKGLDVQGRMVKYSILYSPGIIFSGQVPAFDINFINPGKDKEEVSDNFDDSFIILGSQEGFENFKTVVNDAAQKLFNSECYLYETNDEGYDETDIYSVLDDFIYNFEWNNKDIEINNVKVNIEANKIKGTIKCYDSSNKIIFEHNPKEGEDITDYYRDLVVEELRDFLYNYYIETIYNIAPNEYNPKALEDKEDVIKLLNDFYNNEQPSGITDILKNFEFTHKCGEGNTVICLKYDSSNEIWTIYEIPEAMREIAIEKGIVKRYNSSARILQPIVASWYKALRKIALVGLLSVLVYLGIRIVLSSTSAKDKAKYKKMLKNWVEAVCLLFMLHYIMSLTINVVTQINSIVGTSVIGENGEDVLLSSLRNKIFNAGEWAEVISEVVIYTVITIYTVIFTIQYFRRTIYMAFLTIIAPLITLTYPLDKIKDSKAQAFDMWLKDYIFFSLLQVLHLLIYYIFVSQSITLSEVGTKWSLVYSLVAIGFLTHAEKIMKKMFGFQKSKSMGAIAAGATGALVMNLFNKASYAKFGNTTKGTGTPGNIRTPGKNATTRTATSNPLEVLQTATLGNIIEQEAGNQQNSSQSGDEGNNTSGYSTLENGREQNNSSSNGRTNGEQNNSSSNSSTNAGGQNNLNSNVNTGRQDSTLNNGLNGATIPQNINNNGQSVRHNTNNGNRRVVRSSKPENSERKIDFWGGVKSLNGRYTGPALSKAGGLLLGGAGILIGFSAGVAQGDLGKALGGAVAGGTAGYYGGQKLVNTGSNVIHTVTHLDENLNNIRDTFNEGARGKEFVQNRKFDRAFRASEDYERLMKENPKTPDEYIQKMLNAKITDFKDMNNILKKNKEDPHKYSIDRAIGYYTLAKQCPNSILFNDKKFIRFCQDRDIDITPEEAKAVRRVLIEFK